MASELEREIVRLSNLKQNKDLSDESLIPTAKINLAVRDFHANPLFTDANEQKLAEEKFRNYLENNEIDNSSDIDTLKSLVFNEVFETRLQGELNKLAEQNKYPPDKLIKSLVDVQNQKSSLKIKLGIDRKEEERDDLSAYQLLQKRVHKYIQEHKNEFTLWIPWTCEKCGHKDIESYLIYKRITDFNAIKHPWFVGRYLFNYEIIKDVKDKKLAPEDATRYLMCAGQGGDYKIAPEDKQWCIDFINYCLENFTEITEMLKKN